METGVQNAQIAITIVQLVYFGQLYIFSQQFFFPIIAFVFQVSWLIQIQSVKFVWWLIGHQSFAVKSDNDVFICGNHQFIDHHIDKLNF